MARLTTFGSRARDDGRVVAHVVSAVALKESQISALHDVLSRKLGKQVEVSPGVAPSLIGGLLIYVDGRMIDRTVKKQLGDIKDRLILFDDRKH